MPGEWPAAGNMIRNVSQRAPTDKINHLFTLISAAFPTPARPRHVYGRRSVVR